MFKNKLNPGKERRIIKYAGFRALKWPLISKEVDSCITKLKRYKTTIDFALNTD